MNRMISIPKCVCIWIVCITALIPKSYSTHRLSDVRESLNQIELSGRDISSNLGIIRTFVSYQHGEEQLYDLILKLGTPDIKIVMDIINPCDLQIDIRMFRIPNERIEQRGSGQLDGLMVQRRLDAMCDSYVRVMNSIQEIQRFTARNNNKLKLNTEFLLDQLTTIQRKTRPERDVTEWIRQIFNIGKLTTQRSLANKINLLKLNSQNADHNIHYLAHLVELQNDHLKHSEQILQYQGRVINNLTRVLRLDISYSYRAEIDSEIREKLSKRADELLQHLITNGVVLQQLLTVERQYLVERNEGINDLLKGELTTNLISSVDLKNSLDALALHLINIESSRHIISRPLKHYYKYSRVTGIVVGSDIFVHIPIPIGTHSGLYRVFHIETVGISVNASSDTYHETRIALNNNYIAVSSHDSIIIGKDRAVSACTDNYNNGCLDSLLRTTIEQEYCELEVLLFDFTRIYEHCEVNYQVVNKVQPPLVFNLDNNRIFIFNNGLLDWNMACQDDSSVELVTHYIINITLGCGCYLYSGNRYTSPRFDITCVRDYELVLGDGESDNLMYLAYLYNSSAHALVYMSNNNTSLVDSRFEHRLDELISYHDHAGNVDKTDVYNMRSVRNDIERGLVPQVSPLGSNVEKLMEYKESDEKYQILNWINMGVSILILGFCLVIARRNHLMSTILGVLEATKVDAYPLSPQSECVYNTTYVSVIGILVGMMLIIVIAILYKNRNFIIYLCKDTCCREFVRTHLRRSNTWVSLEIYTAQYSVTCYLAQFKINLNEIKASGYMNPHWVSITNSCCSKNLNINWSNFSLKVKDNVKGNLTFELPGTVGISYVDRVLISHILTGKYRMNLLLSARANQTFNIVTPITMLDFTYKKPRKMKVTLGRNDGDSEVYSGELPGGSESLSCLRTPSSSMETVG